MTYDIKSFMAGLRTGLALPRVTKPKLKIVGWPTGTDAEIADMVAALDSGEITIEETGWQIGEERTVYLSAMEATGVGEAHAAQTAKLVLMDSGDFTLATPTAAGRTTDHFVVGLKDCLDEPGYMNSTKTYIKYETDGYYIINIDNGWESCQRRAWCNQVFRMAIPEPMRSIFKQFEVMTTCRGSSPITTTIDYFTLPATKEVFGRGGTSSEAYYLKTLEYYKTESNRYKKINGTDSSWWLRTVGSRNSNVRIVTSTGFSANSDADNLLGISPFGCI